VDSDGTQGETCNRLHQEEEGGTKEESSQRGKLLSYHVEYRVVGGNKVNCETQRSKRSEGKKSREEETIGERRRFLYTVWDQKRKKRQSVARYRQSLRHVDT
jgi:hypothetical protein